MNLVDSSGWLEYFADGKNAEFFSSAIEDIDSLIVSTINLYEVYKKVLIEKDEEAAIQAIALMQQARIVDVNIPISLTAARLSYDLKIPMADGLILSTARLNDATLWTQDSDFEKIPDAKFIKRSK
ncbi:MAG: type II toxin-antitoxin system VapC family toxin [Calditrichaceae bacterium]|nr:type II toxin-antitoxin system VapC family toxin [Calditrichaceae bacterium]MBN2710581.1 type II toxin-antitoxin system VapC family toxin [Calditrichaceae bacterium]RQV94123.1 MAG: type II toxin-antitoxin system VapC family toxin [Calditrichota bacterium]